MADGLGTGNVITCSHFSYPLMQSVLVCVQGASASPCVLGFSQWYLLHESLVVFGVWGVLRQVWKELCRHLGDVTLKICFEPPCTGRRNCHSHSRLLSFPGMYERTQDMNRHRFGSIPMGFSSFSQLLLNFRGRTQCQGWGEGFRIRFL